MNIALVSREYPPETGWGGIGTYVHRLAHALAALGHDVHVISRSERPEEYARQDNQVRVHRIRERKWRGPFVDRIYHLIPLSEWLYSRRVAQTVTELHRRHPFDIIEAPEYRAEAFHLVRRVTVPVVLKLHTPSFLLNAVNERPRSVREWLVDRMERATARRADAISSPSADLADFILRSWDLPHRRIAVLPNPADPAVREADPWPDAATPPTILFVGRVERFKGAQVLGEAIIDVLRELPTARFILVGAPGDKTVLGGDVALLHQLRDAWQAAGILDRIVLVPWQKDPAALWAYRRQSHVAVVPSLYDNFPNVLLEAMASGRAVVASAVGGIAEVITSGTDGVLVPPGDVAALRTALLDLLKNLPRAQQLGQAGRVTVTERLGAAQIASRTAEWYAQVVARKAQGRRRPIRVLAIITERWINWAKDEGVAIVVPEFLRGLERDGMVTRLIRRSYQPARPVQWGQSGPLSFVQDACGIAWDLTEPLRNLALVLGQWARQPEGFDLLWERQGMYGLSGWVLSWVTGRPLVLNVDAPLIEEYEVLQGAWLGRVRCAAARWILHQNLSRAAAIHVPSRTLAEWLTDTYRVPAAKLHVVPNGVYLDVFGPPVDRQALRRQYGLSDEPVILFVGSLQPWHGCDILLKGFAMAQAACPSAKLFIVGDGKVRATLAAQASALNLNGSIHFAGQVPHARVPEFLALADIAVLPYPPLPPPLPFYFSPIKLFEYMGAGKAIVASRLGQISEVLKDGETGRLVEPGSAEALAHALVGILTAPDRGASMGQRARAAAAAFTWEQQGALLARICRSVVGSCHDD